MRIAAIQMVSSSDVASNLMQAQQLLEEAKSQGAILALLPENFAVFSASQLLEVAAQEDQEQTIQHFLSSQAKRLGVSIIGGTIPLCRGFNNEKVKNDRVRASSLFYDDEGRCIGRYDKLHLFDVLVDDAQGSYSESAHIEQGDRWVVVQWKGVSIGMSVCYDLRFPELYKLLVNHGADVMMVPAAFTQATGEAHWHTLLRSRAIETQCVVVGANQGGQHSPTRQTYGNTVIYDSWGRQLGLHESGPGVVVCDIDLDAQRQLRQKMPVLDHQRIAISTKLK